MKKSLLFILSACIFMFCCSCGNDNASSVSVAEPGYTCKADIDYSGMLAAADVSVTGGGVMSAKLTSPETVSGMEYSYNNGKATVKFKGAEYSPENDARLGGVSKALDKALSKLGISGETVPKSGDGYAVIGNVDNADYTLEFNNEGFPLLLTVPSYSLTVKFNNWKY